MNEQQLTMLQNLSYAKADGTYSLWDDPNFHAELRLPANYRALTDTPKSLEEMGRWTRDTQKERMTVLKVIGDAGCANEAQLRRYLSAVMSPSKTSAHINALRRFGFVQRYQCFRHGHEDEYGNLISIPSPAPITLGYAGYMVLTHFFNGAQFVNPDMWLSSKNYDSCDSNVQRYVALNEIRCQFAENHLAKSWKWFPLLGGQRGIKKPFAMMQIGEDTEEFDSRAFLIFERAQLKQNFVGFLSQRLELYRSLYEEFGYIQIAGAPKDAEVVVVLSVSTAKIGKTLQEEIGLHKYPFEVWLIVDEWFEDRTSPINTAFAVPTEDKSDITRISLDFG